MNQHCDAHLPAVARGIATRPSRRRYARFAPFLAAVAPAILSAVAALALTIATYRAAGAGGGFTPRSNPAPFPSQGILYPVR
ncbi:MAG: hypothetical protein KJZ87_06035 [Thermoguttaceae bacterium]|nr:hypothetical protein [Thermoguttaceae bacterium]